MGKTFKERGGDWKKLARRQQGGSGAGGELSAREQVGGNLLAPGRGGTAPGRRAGGRVR